jgi:hypothetical protein
MWNQISVGAQQHMRSLSLCWKQMQSYVEATEGLFEAASSLQILTGGNGGSSPSDGERCSSEGGNEYEESRAPRDEANAWSQSKTMEIFEKTKFAKMMEIYEWREYIIELYIYVHTYYIYNNIQVIKCSAAG